MADPSPYAILGLRPDAKPAEVEEAYRRLIRRHHPDRLGGDGRRAAEINRAYQQLRGSAEAGPRSRRFPVPHVPPALRPPRRRRGRLTILAVAIAGLAIIANGDEIRHFYRDQVGIGPEHLSAGSPRQRFDLREAPLDTDGIDRSVSDAVRIAAMGETRLAEQSRACHRQLRNRPDPSRLDRCVAFDEAAVRLIGGDMFSQSGPFGFSAVTARQLSAASLMSNDSLAAGSRLAQVRTRVEMALAPSEPVRGPPPDRAPAED